MSLDEQWGSAQVDALTSAAANNWGHYTNAQLRMAQILRKRGRLDRELDQLLWVLFLDLNGPENRAGLDAKMLLEAPPFDVRSAMLPPALIERVRKLMATIDRDLADVEHAFLRAAEAKRNRLMPLAPRVAWSLLAPHLN